MGEKVKHKEKDRSAKHKDKEKSAKKHTEEKEKRDKKEKDRDKNDKDHDKKDKGQETPEVQKDNAVAPSEPKQESTLVFGAPVPVPKPSGKEVEEPEEKKLKRWQDDELEVDSGDEAKGDKRLDALRSLTASSAGKEKAAPGQEADPLDTYMLDVGQEIKKQTEEIAEEEAEDGVPAIGEGMGVMDASRVRSITLDEISALTSEAAVALTREPNVRLTNEAVVVPNGVAQSEEPSKQLPVDANVDAKADKSCAASTQGEVPLVVLTAVPEPTAEQEDEAFHAAFMAQMKKVHGDDKPQVPAFEASATFTGARPGMCFKLGSKGLGYYRDTKQDAAGGVDEVSEKKARAKAKRETDDKKRLARKRAFAIKAALDKKGGDEEQDDGTKGLPKGMLEEERMESDPDQSEESASEPEETESYFDLVKRFTTKKTLPAVDHSKITYRPFKKNFYIQVKEITQMRDHEVDDLRKTNGDIKVRGKNAPRPIKSFLQCGLPEKVIKILQRRDYEKPFPIQMQAIPTLMCGRDLIGVAQTGSGKTLCYVLPMIRHVMDAEKLVDGDGPIGFIVAPTRELALQIQRETNTFCKPLGLFSVCAFGGGPMGEQLSALKKGTHILVGTPGRLIDVLTTSNGKITNLRRVTLMVIDEADRMFDMGFEPQIGMFMQSTRPDKQVAMFSATLPTHVEALARSVLKKPVEVAVGERNAAATNVTQFVEVLDESQKFYRLLQLLGEWHEHGSIIIFVQQQNDVDEMFTELLKFGYPSLSLHGGQDQHDRDFTLQDFKDNVANILIATSVAARGIDVKQVILVINFKVPDHLEDYIHRIGRTGRAGKPGFAFTFVQPDEGDRAQDMIDALRQCGQQVPPKLRALSEDYQRLVNIGEAQRKRRWGGFGGKGFKFDKSEKSQQQRDRQQAKKANMIGEDEGDEMEVVVDKWDEDEPMSGKAQKGKSSSGNGDNDKVKGDSGGMKHSSTLAAAAQIAARMQASAAPVIGTNTESNPNAQPADGAGSATTTPASILMPPPSAVPAAKGLGAKRKTDREIDDLAQKRAEETLKNMTDEQREKQLPVLKIKLKEKLRKEDAERVAEASKGGAEADPPPPPTPPPDELIEVLPVVPGIIQQPVVAIPPQGMLDRSMEAVQTALTQAQAKAAETTEEAARIASALSGNGLTTIAPAGMHADELEINDYPQVARQQISHREKLDAIHELTGARCQVKGQHFANKDKLPEGGRLLYVEVIGPTSMAVLKAKHEVKRMMEALAIRTLNIPGVSRAVTGAPGRYDPLVGK